MAQLFTSWEIENDRAFAQTLERAFEVVDDLRFAFGEIARDFFRSNTAIFTNSPGLYRDYSPAYKKAKIKDPKSYAKPYPMLVRSGRLRASLVEGWGAPGSDTILTIGNRSLIMGTSVDYGVYHQSDAPRTKIPLRKYLFIGPEARRFAPSAATGRLERWLRIISTNVEMNLKKKAFK